MKKILEAKNISREFKIGDGSVVYALKNIHLEIEANKLTVLRGISGSGKTTLINILGTLDIPTSGEVLFLKNEIKAEDNKNSESKPENENIKYEDITKLSSNNRDLLRRREMAFVFQSVALISTMTALENVEFALRLANYPMTERTKRAKECLIQVGLEKRMNHRPGELSGGEQQRVAIARAISHKPKIIFADEPTAELDTSTSFAVVKLFRQLVRENELTIIMTTHDTAMMEIADRVYTLEDGVISDVVDNEITEDSEPKSEGGV